MNPGRPALVPSPVFILQFILPGGGSAVGVFITILYVLLVLCSLFLICLVLIQRGKGGGLAGAFGGVGGSSAFGTKAGDIFTRITIIVAGVWIALNMLLVMMANRRPASAFDAIGPAAAAKKADITPGGAASPAPAAKDRPTPPAAPASPAAPDESTLPPALDDAKPASSPTPPAP
jgi:preprotein translocase subunit SecG